VHGATDGHLRRLWQRFSPDPAAWRKGRPVALPALRREIERRAWSRRMTGRILIRAIRAAGGKYEDIDKLKLSATLDDGIFGLGIVDRRG